MDTRHATLNRLRRRIESRRRAATVPSETESQWQWGESRDATHLFEWLKQHIARQGQVVNWSSVLHVTLEQWFHALMHIITHGAMDVSLEQSMNIMQLTDAILQNVAAHTKHIVSEEEHALIVRGHLSIRSMIESMCRCVADEDLYCATRAATSDIACAPIEDVASMARASEGTAVALGTMAADAMRQYEPAHEDGEITLHWLLDICYLMAIVPDASDVHNDAVSRAQKHVSTKKQKRKKKAKKKRNKK